MSLQGERERDGGWSRLRPDECAVFNHLICRHFSMVVEASSTARILSSPSPPLPSPPLSVSSPPLLCLLPSLSPLLSSLSHVLPSPLVSQLHLSSPLLYSPLLSSPLSCPLSSPISTSHSFPVSSLPFLFPPIVFAFSLSLSL